MNGLSKGAVAGAVTPDCAGADPGARPEAHLEARLDARERVLDALLDRWLPYLGLAVGTALTPFVVPATPRTWVVIGGLVLLAAAWSFAFASPPAARARDPRVGGVYITGLLVLMAALVSQSPFFGFQAFAGYSHSFIYLRGN